MNWERIIGEAIMGDDSDKQLAMDRAEVKMRVCEQITCPATGKVLDQARASVIENTADGEVTYTRAFCSEVIDESMDKLVKLSKETGIPFRILDGRVLFGNGGE